MALVCALLAGCSTPRLPDIGPRYHPANVHALEALPPTIRRVAVLPLAPLGGNSTSAIGAEELSPVLQSELRKTGAFEIVPVSREQLQAWTGRGLWLAHDALPEDFFVRLHQETACDAVLFPALTQYRPYPPLALGLDLRLVSGRDPVVVWAVDELLDAGSDAVVRSAHDYSRAHINSKAGEEAAALQSPCRFAQFASATLLRTLPPRENVLKSSPKPTMTNPKGQR